MPKIIEFEEAPEVQEMVSALVSNVSYSEFGLLRDHAVRITACFKCAYKDDADDADPLTAIAGPHPAKLIQYKGAVKLQVSTDFCVVMDYCFWLGANVAKKTAAVHHALMQIEVRTKGDVVTLKTRRPDIVEFASTVTRFPSGVESIAGILPVLLQAAQRFGAEIARSTSATGEH